MSDHLAKPDYVKVHLALARRALGLVVDVPDLDGPVAMLDADDQAIDDAKARHPARPIQNVQSDAL